MGQRQWEQRGARRAGGSRAPERARGVTQIKTARAEHQELVAKSVVA